MFETCDQVLPEKTISCPFLCCLIDIEEDRSLCCLRIYIKYNAMFSLHFTFETVYDHGKHESINWSSPFQISDCTVTEQRTHTHTRLDGLFCLCEGIPSSRRPRSPSHSGLSICCCAATRSSVHRPPLTPHHPTHPFPGVISTSP